MMNYRHLPKRSCCFSVFSLLSLAFACSCSDTNSVRVFRESANEARRFPIEQDDKNLQMAIFVRYDDGRIEAPTLYTHRVRFTDTGAKQVEEQAASWTPVNKTHPYANLPVASDISHYLLLVRKPILVDDATQRDGIRFTGWSSWKLVEVPLDSVSREKGIRIPAWAEIEADAAEQRALEKKLIAMYEVIAAEEQREMETPVGAHGL